MHSPENKRDPHDQAFFEQMRACRDNYRKLADCIHAVVGKQDSCIDIGCGIGLQTARLIELGWKETKGAEYSPAAIEMIEPGVEVMGFDLTMPFSPEHKLIAGVREYACVICTETAEHIPAEHADAIVDNVAGRATDVIVWSAAAPGQEWEGHINLQYPEYWLSRFRARGWALDEMKTAQLRGLMEMKQAQHWMGRQNFCVLRKEKTLHMTIVSTCFNAEKWVGKCIESVQGQTFRNYHHVVINARSDDMTGDIADHYAETLTQLTVIHNEVRLESLENCWSVWKDLPDDEVIVWLDGDDWLATDEALQVIANAYADPEVWMTYGQFMFSDGEVGFASPYPAGSKPRYMDWRATHLKTFRAGLVKRLLQPGNLANPWCLLRPNGSWIYLATDKAVMWPLLEMAGTHYRCIYQVLSVYNFKAGWAAQRKPEARQVELEEAERIRALPEWQPLTERPW